MAEVTLGAIALVFGCIFGIVIAVRRAAKAGVLQRKFWAIPLFIAFAFLSFPLPVYIQLYMVVAGMAGNWRISPDIFRLWADYSWIYGGLGVLAIWLIIAFNGVVMADVRRKYKYAVLFSCMIGVLGMADSCVFWLLAKDIVDTVMVRGKSPDGKSECVASVTRLCEPAYWLYVRDTSTLPLFWRIGGNEMGFCSKTENEKNGEARIVWAADSSLVALYRGKDATIIYDLRAGQNISLPDNLSRSGEENEEKYFGQKTEMAEKEFALRGGAIR